MKFQEWLILKEYKHLQNGAAGCGHCKQDLKVKDIIIGKHMYPIGQLYSCACRKSKIFTNTVRNSKELLKFINKETERYYNGFCNDKRCGNCFTYIQPLENGVPVPPDMKISKFERRADRYGCPKCIDNQEILIIGQGFMPEGENTTNKFIEFYTKHKDKLKKLHDEINS
jgi:hypothetical protein